MFLWASDATGGFDVTRDLYFVARDVSIDVLDATPTYTYARVEATVSQEFDLRDFPFDRQRLILRIEGEDADAFRLVPDPEGVTLSDYLAPRGWKIDDATLTSETHRYATGFGYAKPSEAAYSQLVLAIDVTRGRSPVPIDDFVGLTFALFVAGLTFFVPCTEIGLRIGMTTASLFAAVLNINRLHDAVGFRPDFGLVDRVAFLVLGALLGAIAIVIATHRVARNGDVARANRLDTILGTLLMTTTLALVLLAFRPALG